MTAIRHLIRDLAFILIAMVIGAACLFDRLADRKRRDV